MIYIGNVATIHNFTKDITEIIPRHLIILREIVEQYISADFKITIIEVIDS